MLDQLPRYAGHVYRFPCEHVDMLSYEANERIFLFRIEVSPDPSGLRSIAVDMDHLLGLD